MSFALEFRNNDNDDNCGDKHLAKLGVSAYNNFSGESDFSDFSDRIYNKSRVKREYMHLIILM